MSFPPISTEQDEQVAAAVQPEFAAGERALKGLRLRRLLWPLLIGGGVLGYALYKLWQEDLDFSSLGEVYSLPVLMGWLALGVGLMVLRDVGYVWRMRILTDRKLGWRSAFEVTMLWEFTSALTPSVVGGSALAIFMLIKEKISAGRSAAIVFITVFLDELFYVVILPVVMLLVEPGLLFGPIDETSGQATFGMGVVVAFWAAYGLIALYTLFLAFALFVRPQGTRAAIRRLFGWRLLRRWSQQAGHLADELLITANEFRRKSWRYWLRAWTATVVAWMGRYLVLNAVLAAFVSLSFYEHWVAFARQAVMFIVMLVSPTPGSSGIAEGMFQRLFQEFAVNNAAGLKPLALILILASIWRLISYYPYLLLGVFLLPRWLRRVYRRDAGEQSM